MFLTLPSINDRDTIVNDDIATLHGAIGNQGEVRVALLECDGPVDKVELCLLVMPQLYQGLANIHQGSPAQAQQGKHLEKPPQLRDGAGFMQSITIPIQRWALRQYLFHNLEVCSKSQ